MGVGAIFVLSVAGCGGSDGERQDSSDAGERTAADASEPAEPSPPSGTNETAATDSGAIGVAPNGLQPDCAELAACCPLTGELRATCEISVQVNDGFNCGATLVILNTMGLCVEDTGDDGGSTSVDPSDSGNDASDVTGNPGDASTEPGDAGNDSGDVTGNPSDAGTEPSDASNNDSTNCENLALGAVASAETTYLGYSAANAIDGNRSTLLGEATSWANDWNSPAIAFPQWFDIELGATHQVSRIELYTTDDYRISEYDYAYRSGSEWVQLGQVTGNTGVHVIHEFPAVQTSAIRILVRRGPEHQFNHARLNEVEIYGASTDACN